MFFRRTVLLTLFKFSDIFIMLLSMALSMTIAGSIIVFKQSPIIPSEIFSGQIRISQLVVLLIIIEAWHITFISFDLYRSRRLGSKFEECLTIIKATTIGTGLLSIFIITCSPLAGSALFIFLFWMISTSLTLVSRMSMRAILMIIRSQGRNLRHVIVIGTNIRAKNFAMEIIHCKEWGYNLLGFIDNIDNDNINHKNKNKNNNNIPLLSDLEHFPEVLNRFIIDEVVVGLPIKSSYEQISKIINLCLEQGIMVRYLLADIFDLRLAQSKIDNLHGAYVLTLFKGPLDSWLLWIKRAADVLLSALSLIILFPLFILVSIMIRLDSTGPIFFIQERVGYNKRRFKLIKFRTMISDAESKQAELEKFNEMGGPVFKIKDDPRITKIGKILRKTSIDELPQLINVLRGDMSLVGPRPLPVRDYNGFDQEWQKRRFSIKPGLTCLWQVNGRNEISFNKWMELDMEYIDNWSLLLDLKILLKTIPAVLKCSGV